MRRMPLERDINIALDGPFLVEVANQEWAIYDYVHIILKRDLPHCLVFFFLAQSEADCHCGEKGAACPAETAKQADDGSDHPEQDEHVEGEHVGRLHPYRGHTPT